MTPGLGRISLRDFFWLILIAAISVGWYLEHSRATAQIATIRDPFAGQAATYTTAGALQRNQLLTQYRALSNAELNQQFIGIKPASPFGVSAEYSCCLTEMARRHMHAELQEHLDDFMKTGNTDFGGPANALLLTTLRRAQQKPDPVEVQLRLTTESKTVAGRLEFTPQILANLKNVDPLPIALTNGGDYRSGRQTRWRVELTNEKGERLPDSNFPTFGMGGGISSFGSVQPDKLISDHGYSLDPRSYVSLPPSGRYQLQVVYSEEEIAAEPDLAGLIVWRSQPLPVIVENRTPQFKNRFSAVPLLAVLVIGLVVVVVVKRRKVVADGTAPAAGLNLRDVVAISLLIGLSTGCLVDSQLQQREIRRVRPDAHTQWTLKPA